MNLRRQNLIKISEETETQFMQKVQETLDHIKGDDGAVSTHGLWKAKNNLILMTKEAIMLR